MKMLLKILFVLIGIGVLIGLSVLTAVCVSAGMRFETKPSDCIVVLGCHVWMDGRMSHALQYRCESALEAWKGGIASVIIACGAQGDNEPCTEAEAIRHWLVQKGVPEDAVIVEDRSTNTRENLENARAIMAKRGFGTAAVCTSNYHLSRSLWLARDLGIDACGIAAPSTKNVVSLVRGRLRETCSWILYFIKR